MAGLIDFLAGYYQITVSSLTLPTPRTFPAWKSIFKRNTKLVFVETPTNPVMTVTDLKAVSDLAHSLGSKVVCDNTFMSPYLQQPISLGVDIVVHSTTKYLNGHSDSVGGFIALNDEQDAEWIGFVQNSIGAILSPFDSFLVLRGTKTLAVRMEAHDRNGRQVANFLTEHPKVEKVYYPGLVSHPQHEFASRQQKGFGGMVSFETGSLDNAKRVLDNVEALYSGREPGRCRISYISPCDDDSCFGPY